MPPVRLLRGLLTYGKRRRTGLDNLHQAKLEELLAAVRPDLVLVEIELYEYLFTVHGAGFRYLLLSPWFQNGSFTGLPPLTSALQPGAKAESARLRQDSRRGRDRYRRLLAGVGNDRASILLKYAWNQNFPPDKLSYAGWPPPFTFRDIPTLHTVAEEMEFPYAAPTTSHYVGPLVPPDGSLPPLSGELRALVERLRATGKRILYTVGSSMEKNGTSNLDRLVAAVEQQTDWALIVSTAGKPIGEDLTVPGNVFAFTWVPQRELLGVVDCCIHHGGINTINECLVAGVPMVVYSGGRHDQPGCAARLRYHGLAIVGNKPDSAEEVAANIRQALTSPEYRQRREAFSQRLREPGRDDRLAEVIQRYLRS